MLLTEVVTLPLKLNGSVVPSKLGSVLAPLNTRVGGWNVKPGLLALAVYVVPLSKPD
jgi:hypothetical protein